MRELAGEDMKAIEDWAEGETKRIQLERERRAAELDEDLERSLAGHRCKIDREIETADGAIATYQRRSRRVLRTSRSRDGPDRDRPTGGSAAGLPALSAVAAPIAPLRCEAAEAGHDVGRATGRDRRRSSGAGTSGRRRPGSGSLDPNAEPEPVECGRLSRRSDGAVPAGATTMATGAARLIQSPSRRSRRPARTTGHIGSSRVVPVLHPMSWLRREAKGGNPPNGEGPRAASGASRPASTCAARRVTKSFIPCPGTARPGVVRTGTTFFYTGLDRDRICRQHSKDTRAPTSTRGRRRRTQRKTGMRAWSVAPACLERRTRGGPTFARGMSRFDRPGGVPEAQSQGRHRIDVGGRRGANARDPWLEPQVPDIVAALAAGLRCAEGPTPFGARRLLPEFSRHMSRSMDGGFGVRPTRSSS